jgi:simple sugar transport system permease protein
MIEAIRISSVDPLAGGGETTFLAVSAAVVGGTSLFGGVGTVIGALLGSLVLAILRIGFTLQGVDASRFNLINGAAVIIAMALNVYVARRRRSGAA